MDRLFLDANVLFSAAWKESSGLRRLWELEDVRLLASPFVVAEARRNLTGDASALRLEQLLESVAILPSEPAAFDAPGVDLLPAKDRPVLMAAMVAGADFLLTGDLAHFGQLMGERYSGVLVTLPAVYLTTRAGTGQRDTSCRHGYLFTS